MSETRSPRDLQPPILLRLTLHVLVGLLVAIPRGHHFHADNKGVRRLRARCYTHPDRRSLLQRLELPRAIIKSLDMSEGRSRQTRVMLVGDARNPIPLRRPM